jgi:pilus assembly protein Flp/PilA
VVAGTGVSLPVSGPPRFGLPESHLQTKKGNSKMIRLLTARIQLAKMRAEEGQALVEYALIVSLIAVVCILALTVTGTSVRDILNSVSSSV